MFFEAVLENLKTQIDYFSQIKELCEREKQFIIDNNLDEVSNIVEELRGLIKMTVKEEDSRIELIKNSEEFSGKEDVALDDIINICTDVKMKDALTSAKNELVRLFKEQKENNQLIEDMLRMNLDYCEYMINALSSEITPNNLYSSDGSEVAKARGVVRILDSEV